MLTPHHRSPDRRPPFLHAVSMLGLTLTVVLGLGIGPATAAHIERAPVAVAAKPSPVTNEIKRADAALTSAVANIGAGHYLNARQSLAVVQTQGKAAQVDATALIGKPPTDPESDDPPGPPAVVAVLGLERRITTAVVPLFDNMTKPKLVHALRKTLRRTQVRRDVMLDAVIGLPAEGAGADYSDDMPDTLGMFSKEVKSISAALANFTLSTSGTTGLTKALARATATKAKMQHAFGGGERPAPAAT